jgi:Tol biopolymer transport system component
VVNPWELGWGRGELWAIRVASGERRRLAGALALQPTWSPDGKWIAFWGKQAGHKVYALWVVPAQGGEPRRLLDGPGVIWSPAFSGDGRWLYFASARSGATLLWRLRFDAARGGALGDPEPVTGGAGAWSHSPSTDRGGGRLAFAVGAFTFVVNKIRYDAAREVVVGAPLPLAVGANPAVHGDLLVTETFPADMQVPHLEIVRTDGTGRRRLTDGHDNHADWSPDGTEVAFMSNRSGAFEVWSIRPDGGRLRQLTRLGPGSWSVPVWGPGPSTLQVTDTSTGKTDVFDPRRPFGEQRVGHLPAPPDRVPLAPVSVSPDGKSLALVKLEHEQSNSDGLWLLERASGAYRKLTDRGNTPHFTPDGRRLVYEDHGTLAIVDLKSGRAHPLLALPQGSVDTCLAVDGEWLYFTHIVETADVWLAALP